mgnify:CR=1 FL=1
MTFKWGVLTGRTGQEYSCKRVIAMGSLEQEVDLEKLQQGIEYRNRFRECMRWTMILGFSAFLLLLCYLVLVMKPSKRTFFVSSTEGTVVKISPVQATSLASSPSPLGNGIKPLLSHHDR